MFYSGKPHCLLNTRTGKMALFAPEKIREIEKKSNKIRQFNIFYMPHGRGIILMAFLELFVDFFFVWLFFVYQQDDDDAEKEDPTSPWLSAEKRVLDKIEPWFMLQRSFTTVSTAFLLIGYSLRLPSLMLPFCLSNLVGILSGLAALIQAKVSLFLSSIIFFHVCLELNNCCSVKKPSIFVFCHFLRLCDEVNF